MRLERLTRVLVEAKKEAESWTLSAKEERELCVYMVFILTRSGTRAKEQKGFEALLRKKLNKEEGEEAHKERCGANELAKLISVEVQRKPVEAMIERKLFVQVIKQALFVFIIDLLAGLWMNIRWNTYLLSTGYTVSYFASTNGGGCFNSKM